MEITLQQIALVPNNTYNYSNSSVFYSLVNSNYLNYYQQVIRKCQEWLDGFDPSFHKAELGIFSTRIGAKITKGVVNQVFGRGLVYVQGNNTNGHNGVDFISHEWADECNFNNVIKQTIGFTFPLGTSLVKINKDSDGELWCEPIRADYFYYAVNGKHQLTEVTIFIRTFQSVKSEDKNYCLVERRYFKTEYPKFTKELNGKIVEFEDKTKKIKVPYVVYKIFEINNTSNNNSLASNSGSGINYKSLPSDVRDMLKENYSAILIDEEVRLPFSEYLGCELFKNEGGDITHPNMPFGSPALFDLISSFMEYDLAISYSMRDLYNSKGVVGVPKALSQGALVPGTGGNLSQTPFSQLNIPGYEYVSGLDPTTQKPIITQFEIRAAEHEVKQNAILKAIATSIGMSPRVIASYLVDGNEKTAEQTHSEDDTVVNWVKSHRQDYIHGINKLIECILSFYGIVDNVEVRFANDGLVSADRQLEIIEKKLNLGLITLEDAVREINPDLDEEQLGLKISQAKTQKAEKEQAQQQQFDETYGDLLDENKLI